MSEGPVAKGRERAEPPLSWLVGLRTGLCAKLCLIPVYSSSARSRRERPERTSIALKIFSNLVLGRTFNVVAARAVSTQSGGQAGQRGGHTNAVLHDHDVNLLHLLWVLPVHSRFLLAFDRHFVCLNRG